MRTSCATDFYYVNFYKTYIKYDIYIENIFTGYIIDL